MGQNESTQKTPVDLDIEEKEQVERDSAKFEEDVVDVFDDEVENIIESSNTESDNEEHTFENLRNDSGFGDKVDDEEEVEILSEGTGRSGDLQEISFDASSSTIPLRPTKLIFCDHIQAIHR